MTDTSYPYPTTLWIYDPSTGQAIDSQPGRTVSNNPIRLSGGIEVVYRLPHDIEGYLDEQWRHIGKLAREGKLVS